MVFIWNCRHAGMRSEVIFFAALFIAGCGVEKEVLFSGTTMATSYHVKIVTGYFRSTSHIPDLIEKRLLEINNSMSTYILKIVK
jgi:hypothetical protein